MSDHMRELHAVHAEAKRLGLGTRVTPRHRLFDRFRACPLCGAHFVSFTVEDRRTQPVCSPCLPALLAVGYVEGARYRDRQRALARARAARYCRECGKTILPAKRSTRRYCSTACRVAHYRRTRMRA